VRVWIDQDLCTGDGLCIDHCPESFIQLEDGIAYVMEAGIPGNDPGGGGSLAWVPSHRDGLTGPFTAHGDVCSWQRPVQRLNELKQLLLSP
jgi:ferredoxin